MGKGGFMSSKLTTIILAVILVIFAVVLYIVYTKTAGFSTLRPKPKIEKPSGISMYHNPTIPSDQVILQESADLSWKKLA
jgi:hypothetical protein